MHRHRRPCIHPFTHRWRSPQSSGPPASPPPPPGFLLLLLPLLPLLPRHDLAPHGGDIVAGVADKGRRRTRRPKAITSSQRETASHDSSAYSHPHRIPEDKSGGRGTGVAAQELRRKV